ncbi:MAG: hypothetical protein SPJ62_14705 [Inconstantimicrobium porci]|uniref:hypothetical protein n=1 Tax=Inconstantimicrobium porci TaxID=2652291 RepID=UPI002A90D5C8|nr:hypothetical protein [Inconstantimicrobium porci]MDY5913220.1 hypothetical protein [Inconstantimicrobium porci]
MYRELLEEYERIDLAIISSLEKDTDEFIELFDKREKIVQDIVKLTQYKDEVNKEFKVKKLDELDKKIKKILGCNIAEVKNKIKNSQKGQKAFNGYTAAKRVPNFYTRIL